MKFLYILLCALLCCFACQKKDHTLKNKTHSEVQKKGRSTIFPAGRAESSSGNVNENYHEALSLAITPRDSFEIFLQLEKFFISAGDCDSVHWYWYQMRLICPVCMSEDDSASCDTSGVDISSSLPYDSVILQVGHTSAITNVQISDGEKHIVSGGMNGTVIVWDVARRRQIFSFKNGGFSITSVDIIDAPPWVAAGTHSGYVRVWNFVTRELVFEARPFKWDDSFGDRWDCFCNADRGWLEITNNFIGVDKVQMSNDGDYIAAVTGNHCMANNVAVWNLKGGKELRGEEEESALTELKNEYYADTSKSENRSLSITENGDYLKLADVKTGLIDSLKSSYDALEELSMNGPNMLLINRAQNMQVVDLSNARPVVSLQKPYYLKIFNDSSFECAAYEDSIASYYEISASSVTQFSYLKKTYKLHQENTIPGREDGIRIGNFLLKSEENKLIVIDKYSGDTVGFEYVTEYRITQVVVSLKNKYILTLSHSGGNADGNIAMDVFSIDSTNGKLKNIFKEILSVVGCPVDFSADDSLLAFGFWHTFKVLELNTGRLSEFGNYPRSHSAKSMGAIEFAKENNMLIVSYSKIVDVYNLSTKQPIIRLLGHHDQINSIFFDDKKNRIFTGSEDGSIRVWDSNSFENLVTMASFQDTSFFAMTPERYFCSTKGGFRAVSLIRNGIPYGFDQFDILWNRPSIILKALGYASPKRIELYEDAYIKRLKAYGWDNPQENNITVPSVGFVQRNLPVFSSIDSISLHFWAVDSINKIAKAMITNNGCPVKKINHGTNPGTSIDTAVFCPLISGINIIELSAQNILGIESHRERIIIRKERGGYIPELYFAGIAISNYHDSLLDLEYPTKDLNDLSKIFGSNTEAFSKVHILTLSNDSVDMHLNKRVKDFFSGATIDDVAVLFVAGHGFLDTAFNYYIANATTDPRKPTKTAISLDTLKSIIASLAPQRRVIFLDACQSGKVYPDVTPVDVSYNCDAGLITARAIRYTEVVPYEQDALNLYETMRSTYIDIHHNEGINIFASSSAFEYALEGRLWNNGVFTYALLEGLRNLQADYNRDGAIMVSELFGYVEKKVLDLTAKAQTPELREVNIDFDFRIF